MKLIATWDDARPEPLGAAIDAMLPTQGPLGTFDVLLRDVAQLRPSDMGETTPDVVITTKALMLDFGIKRILKEFDHGHAEG